MGSGAARTLIYASHNSRAKLTPTQKDRRRLEMQHLSCLLQRESHRFRSRPFRGLLQLQDVHRKLPTEPIDDLVRQFRSNK